MNSEETVARIKESNETAQEARRIAMKTHELYVNEQSKRHDENEVMVTQLNTMAGCMTELTKISAKMSLVVMGDEPAGIKGHGKRLIDIEAKQMAQNIFMVKIVAAWTAVVSFAVYFKDKLIG